MFQVKVCGITSVEDARMAADAGADAIGLNFYDQSPRYIERRPAMEIVAAVGDRVQVVGVFVNASVEQVIEIADGVPLDLIQLHGDEPIEHLLRLQPRQVLQAFRLRPNDMESIARRITEATLAGAPSAAVLIDAYEKGSYGGTGKQANWGDVADLAKKASPCPIVLAGGLHAENVASAVRQSRCHAVDVASGVEISPGKKDAEQTRRFVGNAKAALAHPL